MRSCQHTDRKLIRATNGLWGALREDILSGISSRPLSVAMIATRYLTDHDPKDRDLIDVEEVVVGLMFRGNLRRSPRSCLDMFKEIKMLFFEHLALV